MDLGVDPLLAGVPGPSNRVVGHVVVNDFQKSGKVLFYAFKFLATERAIKIGQITVDWFETGINRCTTTRNETQQDAPPICRIGLTGYQPRFFEVLQGSRDTAWR